MSSATIPTLGPPLSSIQPKPGIHTYRLPSITVCVPGVGSDEGCADTAASSEAGDDAEVDSVACAASGSGMDLQDGDNSY